MTVARRLGSALLTIGPVIVALVVWELAANSVQSFYFPPFSDVVAKLRDDWLFEATLDHLVPSMVRFFAGYLLGAAIGVALGVLVGAFKSVSLAIEPTLEFLRAMPAVALFPVAVLLFGLGTMMRVSVITLGVLFPVMINTVVGIRNTRQERIDTARMFGLRRWQVIARVMIPSAAPMIATGLRIALPIGLILMVVSELIGGQNGVGSYIQYRQSLFDVAGMFSALIVLGVVGNLVGIVYHWIETRWLAWSRDQ